ncbi:Senescence-associated carboxylesterase [Cardamine amara subsp. amara]|uniref:Senescence-associated carboxylesterase n=1 Tax=Cardamine amara subsp. amara TaxID=228776 RepID=A0ABD1C3A2_CARAN
MEDSSVKGLALGNLVLSSGLLHNSWSKISELHESRPNQDSSSLGIKTYQEAKYTLVVFDAKSIYSNSSASTLLKSETMNPFPLLFSEKIPSFSVHASAFSLFTSAYESLTELKSKLLELLRSRKPVIITGAALGGSVASLFTLWLLETIDPRLKRPLCITFGSPLIGDASLQQILENSVRNSCFLHVADAAKTCIKSDFFKPFGTYLICFGSECICIQDPEVVTELLLNGVDFYQVDYGKVIRRLDQSVLSMTDSKLIPHEVIKRMIERPEKPKVDLHKKLIDMKISMMYIEWYKKMCKKDKIGYYDGFKTETFFSEFQNVCFINIKNHKINLNDFWKSVVEEVEKKPPSDTSIRKRYILSGNSYRKMMEPLDIAEYYLDGRKEYRNLGRSHHYVMLEKWFIEENRDLSDLLTFDSCFWAEVEESLIVINLLKTTVGMRDRELLTVHLVRFEEYVWGMIIRREVSPEIFWEKSCFMGWWKEYKAIKGSNSPPSDFMEYMNTEMYESYGQPMKERIY